MSLKEVTSKTEEVEDDFDDASDEIFDGLTSAEE